MVEKQLRVEDRRSGRWFNYPCFRRLPAFSLTNSCCGEIAETHKQKQEKERKKKDKKSKEGRNEEKESKKRHKVLCRDASRKKEGKKERREETRSLLSAEGSASSWKFM